VGPTFETGPGAFLVPSTETFAAVEAGDSHTCALNTAGKAFCWGFNLAFQLGGESESTIDGPVEIIGQP
jgi:alpha-tubulin suppressor-like RCC1 family protein